MRCGWGPYFRRTFEVQAGNSPLQGQSKPPAKLVVLIMKVYILFLTQKECIREHPKPQYLLRASVSAARKVSLWGEGKRKRFPLQPFAGGRW